MQRYKISISYLYFIQKKQINELYFKKVSSIIIFVPNVHFLKKRNF